MFISKGRGVVKEAVKEVVKGRSSCLSRVYSNTLK